MSVTGNPRFSSQRNANYTPSRSSAFSLTANSVLTPFKTKSQAASSYLPPDYPYPQTSPRDDTHRSISGLLLRSEAVLFHHSSVSHLPSPGRDVTPHLAALSNLPTPLSSIADNDGFVRPQPVARMSETSSMGYTSVTPCGPQLRPDATVTSHTTRTTMVTDKHTSTPSRSRHAQQGRVTALVSPSSNSSHLRPSSNDNSNGPRAYYISEGVAQTPLIDTPRQHQPPSSTRYSSHPQAGPSLLSPRYPLQSHQNHHQHHPQHQLPQHQQSQCQELQQQQLFSEHPRHQPQSHTTQAQARSLVQSHLPGRIKAPQAPVRSFVWESASSRGLNSEITDILLNTSYKYSSRIGVTVPHTKIHRNDIENIRHISENSSFGKNGTEGTFLQNADRSEIAQVDDSRKTDGKFSENRKSPIPSALGADPTRLMNDNVYKKRVAMSLSLDNRHVQSRQFENDYTRFSLESSSIANARQAGKNPEVSTSFGENIRNTQENSENVKTPETLNRCPFIGILPVYFPSPSLSSAHACNTHAQTWDRVSQTSLRSESPELSRFPDLSDIPVYQSHWKQTITTKTHIIVTSKHAIHRQSSEEVELRKTEDSGGCAKVFPPEYAFLPINFSDRVGFIVDRKLIECILPYFEPELRYDDEEHKNNDDIAVTDPSKLLSTVFKRAVAAAQGVLSSDTLQHTFSSSSSSSSCMPGHSSAQPALTSHSSASSPQSPKMAPSQAQWLPTSQFALSTMTFPVSSFFLQIMLWYASLLHFRKNTLKYQIPDNVKSHVRNPMGMMATLKKTVHHCIVNSLYRKYFHTHSRTIIYNYNSERALFPTPSSPDSAPHSLSSSASIASRPTSTSTSASPSTSTSTSTSTPLTNGAVALHTNHISEKGRFLENGRIPDDLLIALEEMRNLTREFIWFSRCCLCYSWKDLYSVSISAIVAIIHTDGTEYSEYSRKFRTFPKDAFPKMMEKEKCIKNLSQVGNNGGSSYAGSFLSFISRNTAKILGDVMKNVPFSRISRSLPFISEVFEIPVENIVEMLNILYSVSTLLGKTLLNSRISLPKDTFPTNGRILDHNSLMSHPACLPPLCKYATLPLPLLYSALYLQKWILRPIYTVPPHYQPLMVAVLRHVLPKYVGDAFKSSPQSLHQLFSRNFDDSSSEITSFGKIHSKILDFPIKCNPKSHSSPLSLNLWTFFHALAGISAKNRENQECVLFRHVLSRKEDCMQEVSGKKDENGEIWYSPEIQNPTQRSSVHNCPLFSLTSSPFTSLPCPAPSASLHSPLAFADILALNRALLCMHALAQMPMQTHHAPSASSSSASSSAHSAHSAPSTTASSSPSSSLSSALPSALLVHAFLLALWRYFSRAPYTHAPRIHMRASASAAAQASPSASTSASTSDFSSFSPSSPPPPIPPLPLPPSPPLPSVSSLHTPPPPLLCPPLPRSVLSSLLAMLPIQTYIDHAAHKRIFPVISRKQNLTNIPKNNDSVQIGKDGGFSRSDFPTALGAFIQNIFHRLRPYSSSCCTSTSAPVSSASVASAELGSSQYSDLHYTPWSAPILSIPHTTFADTTTSASSSPSSALLSSSSSSPSPSPSPASPASPASSDVFTSISILLNAPPPSGISFSQSSPHFSQPLPYTYPLPSHRSSPFAPVTTCPTTLHAHTNTNADVQAYRHMHIHADRTPNTPANGKTQTSEIPMGNSGKTNKSDLKKAQLTSVAVPLSSTSSVNIDTLHFFLRECTVHELFAAYWRAKCMLLLHILSFLYRTGNCVVYYGMISRLLSITPRYEQIEQAVSTWYGVPNDTIVGKSTEIRKNEHGRKKIEKDMIMRQNIHSSIHQVKRTYEKMTTSTENLSKSNQNPENGVHEMVIPDVTLLPGFQWLLHVNPSSFAPPSATSTSTFASTSTAAAASSSMTSSFSCSPSSSTPIDDSMNTVALSQSLTRIIWHAYCDDIYQQYLQICVETYRQLSQGSGDKCQQGVQKIDDTGKPCSRTKNMNVHGNCRDDTHEDKNYGDNDSIYKTLSDLLYHACGVASTSTVGNAGGAGAAGRLGTAGSNNDGDDGVRDVYEALLHLTHTVYMHTYPHQHQHQQQQHKHAKTHNNAHDVTHPEGILRSIFGKAIPTFSQPSNPGDKSESSVEIPNPFFPQQPLLLPQRPSPCTISNTLLRTLFYCTIIPSHIPIPIPIPVSGAAPVSTSTPAPTFASSPSCLSSLSLTPLPSLFPVLSLPLSGLDLSHIRIRTPSTSAAAAAAAAAPSAVPLSSSSVASLASLPSSQASMSHTMADGLTLAIELPAPLSTRQYMQTRPQSGQTRQQSSQIAQYFTILPSLQRILLKSMLLGPLLPDICNHIALCQGRKAKFSQNTSKGNGDLLKHVVGNKNLESNTWLPISDVYSIVKRHNKQETSVASVGTAISVSGNGDSRDIRHNNNDNNTSNNSNDNHDENGDINDETILRNMLARDERILQQQSGNISRENPEFEIMGTRSFRNSTVLPQNDGNNHVYNELISSPNDTFTGIISPQYTHDNPKIGNPELPFGNSSFPCWASSLFELDISNNFLDFVVTGTSPALASCSSVSPATLALPSTTASTITVDEATMASVLATMAAITGLLSQPEIPEIPFPGLIGLHATHSSLLSSSSPSLSSTLTSTLASTFIPPLLLSLPFAPTRPRHVALTHTPHSPLTLATLTTGLVKKNLYTLNMAANPMVARDTDVASVFASRLFQEKSECPTPSINSGTNTQLSSDDDNTLGIYTTIQKNLQEYLFRTRISPTYALEAGQILQKSPFKHLIPKKVSREEAYLTFCYVLQQQQNLRHLSLAYSELPSNVIIALASALANNQAILYVDIHGLSFDSRAFGALQSLLEHAKEKKKGDFSGISFLEKSRNPSYWENMGFSGDESESGNPDSSGNMSRDVIAAQASISLLPISIPTHLHSSSAFTSLSPLSTCSFPSSSSSSARFSFPTSTSTSTSASPSEDNAYIRNPNLDYREPNTPEPPCIPGLVGLNMSANMEWCTYTQDFGIYHPNFAEISRTPIQCLNNDNNDPLRSMLTARQAGILSTDPKTQDSELFVTFAYDSFMDALMSSHNTTYTHTYTRYPYSYAPPAAPSKPSSSSSSDPYSSQSPLPLQLHPLIPTHTHPSNTGPNTSTATASSSPSFRAFLKAVNESSLVYFMYVRDMPDNACRRRYHGHSAEDESKRDRHVHETNEKLCEARGNVSEENGYVWRCDGECDDVGTSVGIDMDMSRYDSAMLCDDNIGSDVNAFVTELGCISYMEQNHRNIAQELRPHSRNNICKLIIYDTNQDRKNTFSETSEDDNHSSRNPGFQDSWLRPLFSYRMYNYDYVYNNAHSNAASLVSISPSGRHTSAIMTSGNNNDNRDACIQDIMWELQPYIDLNTRKNLTRTKLPENRKFARKYPYQNLLSMCIPVFTSIKIRIESYLSQIHSQQLWLSQCIYAKQCLIISNKLVALFGTQAAMMSGKAETKKGVAGAPEAKTEAEVDTHRDIKREPLTFVSSSWSSSSSSPFSVAPPPPLFSPLPLSSFPALSSPVCATCIQRIHAWIDVLPYAVSLAVGKVLYQEKLTHSHDRSTTLPSSSSSTCSPHAPSATRATTSHCSSSSSPRSTPPWLPRLFPSLQEQLQHVAHTLPYAHTITAAQVLRAYNAGAYSINAKHNIHEPTGNHHTRTIYTRKPNGTAGSDHGRNLGNPQNIPFCPNTSLEECVNGEYVDTDVAHLVQYTRRKREKHNASENANLDSGIENETLKLRPNVDDHVNINTNTPATNHNASDNNSTATHTLDKQVFAKLRYKSFRVFQHFSDKAPSTALDTYVNRKKSREEENIQYNRDNIESSSPDSRPFTTVSSSNSSASTRSGNIASGKIGFSGNYHPIFPLGLFFIDIPRIPCVLCSHSSLIHTQTTDKQQFQGKSGIEKEDTEGRGNSERNAERTVYSEYLIPISLLLSYSVAHNNIPVANSREISEYLHDLRQCTMKTSLSPGKTNIPSHGRDIPRIIDNICSPYDQQGNDAMLSTFLTRQVLQLVPRPQCTSLYTSSLMRYVYDMAVPSPSSSSFSSSSSPRLPSSCSRTSPSCSSSSSRPLLQRQSLHPFSSSRPRLAQCDPAQGVCLCTPLSLPSTATCVHAQADANRQYVNLCSFASMVCLGKDAWCEILWKNIQNIGNSDFRNDMNAKVQEYRGTGSRTLQLDGENTKNTLYQGMETDLGSGGSSGYMNIHRKYDIPDINENMNNGTTRNFGKFQLKIPTLRNPSVSRSVKSAWDEVEWELY